MPNKIKTNYKVWSNDCTGYHTAVAGGPPIFSAPLHTKVAITDSCVTEPGRPGWRKLIARHENATTGMVGDRRQLRQRAGFVSLLYADGTVDVVNGPTIDQSCLSPITLNDYLINSVADNRARTKLLEKYISIKSTWRGGNFLAEIAETVEMFKHPVKSFYRRTYTLAKDVKRLGRVYRADPHRYGRELSNLWLAYVFGVRPTVNDANDLMETLNGLVNGYPVDSKGIRAHGHFATSSESEGPFNLSISAANPGYRQCTTDKTDSHVWYYGAVTCRPQNANMFLLEKFGVTAFDILPAVWEAIPWSFFIDYFVNVQTMLDSIRYADADFAWLARTYRNARVVRSGPIIHQPMYGTTRCEGSGGGGWRLATRVDRRAIPDVPYPSWTFRVPGLTSLKWLNTAALAEQIRSSRPLKK